MARYSHWSRSCARPASADVRVMNSESKASDCMAGGQDMNARGGQVTRSLAAAPATRACLPLACAARLSPLASSLLYFLVDADITCLARDTSLASSACTSSSFREKEAKCFTKKSVCR